MKKILQIVFMFLVSTISMWTLSAQTLDEILALAESENLGLKAAESRYLAAVEQVPQVGQLPDPEFGLGVFPLPIETRLGAQVVRVGATQMIPWFGKLKEEKNLARVRSEIVQQDVFSNLLQLRFKIKKAYFELYEMDRSILILERKVDLLNALQAFVLGKVESGKATSSDVLRIQLKLSELSNRILILDKARMKPVTTINQLLNRQLDTPIQIQDSLAFAYSPIEKKELYSLIENNQPQLRKIEVKTAAAEISKTINNIHRKPSFGVGLDYIMVNQRDDIDPPHNGRDVLQLRGSVKIPISYKKYHAKDREENLKIEGLKQQKEALLTRFLAEIDKAVIDLETAELRLDLYHKQIELNQAALSVLKSNYSATGNKFEEILRLESEGIEYDLKILKTIVESHITNSFIATIISSSNNSK